MSAESLSSGPQWAYIVQGPDYNGDSNMELHFAGNAEALNRMRRGIAAVALEAVAQGEIGERYIATLFEQMNMQEPADEVVLWTAQAETLLEITPRSQDNSYARADRIIRAASQGHLTAEQALSEVGDTRGFTLKSDDAHWLTKDGYEAKVNSSGTAIEPWAEAKAQDELAALHKEWAAAREHHIDGDTEYDELATTVTDEDEIYFQAAGEDIPVNTTREQYELVWRKDKDNHDKPVLLSDRNHTTYGFEDERGNFTPYLSVLDHRHPAHPSNLPEGVKPIYIDGHDPDSAPSQ